MTDPAIAALTTRVADLEDQVADLRLRLAELEWAAAHVSPAAPDPAILVAQGLTQEEIGRRLRVSSRTIRRRLKSSREE
jgi:DNA-directed RNA polymerase specialized sigma24 family protein